MKVREVLHVLLAGNEDSVSLLLGMFFCSVASDVRSPATRARAALVASDLVSCI